MTSRRASHAKQLIEDELLLEAFAGVREKLVLQIETRPLGGDERVDMQLHMALQALRQVRHELERYLSTERMDEFFDDRAGPG